MGDPDYEKAYLARKKKLRELHKKLADTKANQEIYHRIMGSVTEDNDSASEEEEEEVN